MKEHTVVVDPGGPHHTEFTIKDSSQHAAERDRAWVSSERERDGLKPLDAPRTIEQEAGWLVRDGDRAKTYGHPRGDFDRVGKMWSAILGIPVTAEQVALMMIAFKLARATQTPQHRDTQVDIIGYTICLDRLNEE
jgi:Domain of unknown function (DUF6378)